MEKLSNKEREERKKLANEYRRKILKEQSADFDSLTDSQQAFSRGMDGELMQDLVDGLENKTYSKPSEFFTKNCEWLFEKNIIFPCHRDSFLYQVDNCIKYPYTVSYYRRPFRSASYCNYVDKIMNIFQAYQNRQFKKSFFDVCKGNLTREENAYMEEYPYDVNPFDIAYTIDMGDKDVVNYVAETLRYGSTEMITHSILSGVFMSGNSELHKLVGKLLTAGRLQEGLRQAICETCDDGVVSAYMTILNIISKNDLIRFSSVKRAVGAWTAILAFDVKDLDRISKKTFELIINCLNDSNFREECLKDSDTLKIYIALWSYACSDIVECVKKIDSLIESGDRHKILVSALVTREFGIASANVTEKLVMNCSEMTDVMAIAVPMLFNVPYDTHIKKRKIFGNKEKAEKLYDILLNLYKSLDKKSVDFSPCVFPWNAETLSKSDIIKKLADVASYLGDNDKIDEICPKIREIELGEYGTRSNFVELLLSEPKTEIQLNTLIDECADREEYCRETAFKILAKQSLRPEHFTRLESMLKYKSADIRSNIIQILLTMDSNSLLETVKRLVSAKKEEKRTAGLDIILQIKKNPEKGEIYGKFAELADIIATPTSKEKILIDEIKNSDNSEKVYGYGLFDENSAYNPVRDKNFEKECKKVFQRYFPKKNKADFAEPLKKLDSLIELHKNDEYKNRWGSTILLGQKYSMETTLPDGSEGFAFSELWEDFYSHEIKTPEMLVRMFVFVNMLTNLDIIKEKNITIFGKEFSEDISLAYVYNINIILGYLVPKFAEKDLPYIGFHLSFALLDMKPSDIIAAVRKADKRAFFHSKSYYFDGEKVVETDGGVFAVFSYSPVNFFMNFERENNFEHYFAVSFMLAEKTGFFELVKGKYDKFYNNVCYSCPGTTDFLRACYLGIISEDYLYRHIFEFMPERQKSISAISEIVSFYRDMNRKQSNRRQGYLWYNRGFSIRNLLGLGTDEKIEITPEKKPLIEFVVSVYEKISKIILDTELKRGDTPSEFTDFVNGFCRIYGLEYFVKILTALGKDTLVRSIWSVPDNADKKTSLSYLLGVCVPNQDDSAEKLRELLKNTDITEKRLVESALYAPQWIDIVRDYLGWEGFKSACYYFIAHMNERVSDSTKAVIAKYTPISSEDLMSGAFDINWFKDAYETIGEERFGIIYDSAKYISDGAKHSRARKYADAVMDRLDKSEIVKNITEKRNKDTLIAYSLIPLKSKKDLTERYLLLQDFKKQSSQFGSQRKASEGKAVEIAMQNLAENAGYQDVTRLTLSMETKLFDDIKPLLDFSQIDDISVRLSIDDFGKTSVECVKNGKTLKSVPAKYKKHEKILELNEVKKQLTEQYRRTKIMLEQSMEDRVSFTAGEIDLLTGNPVINSLIKNLVYISDGKSGFFENMSLVSHSGEVLPLDKKSGLIIAHPFDLYTENSWHNYQKILFDKKIKQPFKQVFRELYVKTADEVDMYNSMRYSGNQIQPAKTVACLKSRRWIADTEDGLQKVYYKENIIARIYALADWFSPADIEAPTLEWVEFSDRKTGKPIKIKDIPDIIFSEVMRDVDLAVSVAHAGDVDPETSHSTIEMRKAICEFTMPLFKLENVTFTKNHALISGQIADYSVHLGSGVVHIQGGPMINVLPVHSQHRGKIFLPFVDDDPKTSQIISEILLFADDKSIKDPFILDQIR